MGSDAAFTALTTQRLVLRRFRPEDLDAFVAYPSDETANYQSWEAPYRPSQARQFLRELEAIRARRTGGSAGLICQNQRRVVFLTLQTAQASPLPDQPRAATLKLDLTIELAAAVPARGILSLHWSARSPPAGAAHHKREESPTAAGPGRPTPARLGRGCRPVYANRGPGRPWTARTLARPPAVAAAAPASSNASALRRQRTLGEPPPAGCSGRALGYASAASRSAAYVHPSPTAATSSQSVAINHRRWELAARVGIRTA